MTRTAKQVSVLGATTVVFVALLWLGGLGFGHELRLSHWLARPFLGSTVYFGTWFVFVATFVLGLGIPLAVVRLVLREPLSDFGFSLGDAKEGITWLLVLTPLYVLVPLGSAYVGTDQYYTYLVEPGFLTPIHVAIHCVSYGMFAFGFEGFFRGFLLFGLARALAGRRGGQWAAVAIAAVASSASLVGLPWVFPVSALLAGLPAGLLNLRLRSFVYFAMIHWNIGIWSDVWEILKLNVAHHM